MKSIFKAVATVTIFSILTRLLGFLFRIFISRKLGAEGLGLFQMSSSVLGIFMTLISSGIPLTTAKLVSKYESNNELIKRNKCISSALIIACVVALISSLVIFILKSVWGIILTDNRAGELLLIMIPSILCSAAYAVFRGALWGQSDYFNVGLTELIEQILRFAITAIMLYNITDYFIAAKYSAIAFNLTCLLSALITMFIYLKRGQFDFKRGEYVNVMRSAAPITGVRLASSIAQPLTSILIPTMLIVAGYSNSQAVASFGVVMGMTFPMLFVPMAIIGSISMVLIPSISSMMSKNQYDEISNNISQAINVSIFISLLFVPLYLSVGDLIGIVLYDNVMSGVLLQISAICVLPITLCNLTGSILNALNLEVKSFVNYLIGSGVLFVSLIIFTPLIAINAVVVSFGLSMSTISVLNLRKIKKAVPHTSFNIITSIYKYILIILPCSLLGHFASNIAQHFFSYFFSAVIGGGLAIVADLACIYLFKIFDLKDIIHLIYRKKHKKT